MARGEFRWVHLAVLVPVLSLLYVAVRCLNLDLFVTTDEPFWLGRSANFYRALRQDDYAHTYQMAHPGVLTMWAGMAAYAWAFPDYVHHVATNLNHVYGVGDVIREFGEDPMQLLITARIFKMFLQALFFGIALLYLHRLFGGAVMVIAALLIALDPYVSGMDSLLHVDGLFAISALAALLAIAAAVQASPDAMSPWVIAGILSGCAWMTRATGILLVVIVVGIAFAQVYSRRRTYSSLSFRSALEAPAFGGMLWATGAMAASLILLPALWVDPFGTMQQIWNWSSDAASEGHERPTFFLGDIHAGDPGFWFYPVTLLWRMTPVSLLGVTAFLVLVPFAYLRGWITKAQMQSVAILIVFVAAYTLGMTFGAKKFDRYILPVYPVISVLVAIGTALGAQFLRGLRPRWRAFALPVLAAVLVAGQAGSLVGSLPYRLDYFNPMMGGLANAQHAVHLGWGEGGGEVMDFVVADAAGRNVVVQKSSATPIFSYLAPSNVRFDDFGIATPAGWYETDYFVVGIQEWQRDLSPAFHVLQDFDPAHVVDIGGVPFFKTWTPRQLPLPDPLRAETGCTSYFAQGLRLMQVIGRDDTIDLYWLTVDELPYGEVDVRVTLVGSGEHAVNIPAQEGTWVPAPQEHVSKVTITDPRPGDTSPLADYTLIIQVLDPVTGRALPATLGGKPLVEDQFVTTSECFYAV